MSDKNELYIRSSAAEFLIFSNQDRKRSNSILFSHIDIKSKFKERVIMYKSDKNFTIGLWGMLFSMILFFVFLFLEQSNKITHLPIAFIFIWVGVFFMGYIFGGIKGGFVYDFWWTFIVSIAVLIGLIGRIIGRDKLGLIFLIFFTLLMVIPYVQIWVKNKFYKNADNVEEIVDEEDESEEIYSNFEQSKSIFLIKPNILSTDIVYKLVYKDESIYFCRVGGQFYDIDYVEAKYNENMSDNTFFQDNRNFKVPKNKIINLEISDKKSLHTGAIPNNGTVIIMQSNNRKNKFIIHPVQDSEVVHNFFFNLCRITTKFKKVNKNSAKDDRLKVEHKEKSFDYKKAEKLTNFFNGISLFFFMWMLCYPYPYFLLTIVNTIFPIIGIGLYIKYKKYVEFDEERGRKHPNVASMVVFPSLVLAIRAMLDFNIIYANAVWIYVSVLAGILLLVIMLFTEEYKKQKWLVVFIPVILFAYSFGLIILYNIILDNSEPAKYITKIQNKHISSSKAKEYYITVDPWGAFKDNFDVKVSTNLYERAEKGQKINVYEFKGKLGIRWYEIED